MAAVMGQVGVSVQEDHTADQHLRSVAAWGADVATAWPVADATARVPQLSMVRRHRPDDQHPVADVRLGQDAIWQAVTAVVAAGPSGPLRVSPLDDQPLPPTTG